MGELVLIALGCNVGDCKGRLKSALGLVASRVAVRGVSSLYRSPPYGVLNQPPFLNAALWGFTDLPPRALLSFLKDVEKKLGRQPRCRWCEREIDLDLIYYGNLVINAPGLLVPHPERLKRAFVLKPAAEILPAFEDPIVKKSLKELARKVPDPQVKPVGFEGV